MKKSRTVFGLMILVFGGLLGTAARGQMDSDMNVNVKDAPMRGVLEMIAAKAGLQLVMGNEPGVNVTLAQSGVSARKLLDKLATDHQIEYTISGNQLIVTHRAVGGSIGDSHLIHLNYANAKDVATKLKSIVGGEEQVLVDERENNVIFMGSRVNFEKIRSLATLFDTTPKQIMIEALIVETSHNFIRQLGISMSGFGDTISTAGPRNPNGDFRVKTVLQTMDSKMLEVRLTAAEADGDAKVISRPKVITLNNRPAKVTSGLTYYIKTLSNVVTSPTAQNQNNQSAGSGLGGGGVVTGGVTSLQAGLNLEVLPTMVGEEDIRLTVDIDNSTSDLGSAVDGIPGVLKNSANTTVVVKNKQTAVIAGLIKQSKAKNHTGVPILSDIPLIGMLFRSSETSDQNNELVIFLTPTVGNPEPAKINAFMSEDEKAVPVESVRRSPSASAAPAVIRDRPALR